MRISSSILWSPEGLWSAGGNVRLPVSTALEPWPMRVTVDFWCAPSFADVVLRGLDGFVAMLMSCSLSSGNVDFFKRERRCIHYRRILRCLRAAADKKSGVSGDSSRVLSVLYYSLTGRCRSDHKTEVTTGIEQIRVF